MEMMNTHLHITSAHINQHHINPSEHTATHAQAQANEEDNTVRSSDISVSPNMGHIQHRCTQTETSFYPDR